MFPAFVNHLSEGIPLVAHSLLMRCMFVLEKRIKKAACCYSICYIHNIFVGNWKKMNCTSKKFDCGHHRLFNEFISLGIDGIKNHFYVFSSVVVDMYSKDDARQVIDFKNPNDMTCYLYMTKSNRIQYLNSLAGKYIFLRRPEGQRNLVWTLLLTFSPIPDFFTNS